MKPILVLLSGGIDSATLAAKLQAQGREVHALTVLVSPKKTTGLECAKAFVSAWHIPHQVADISTVERILNGRVVREGGSINECEGIGHKAAPLSVELMHMTAAMVALSQDIADIYWAVNADDFVRTERKHVLRYLRFMERLIRLHNKPIRFHTPFATMPKADVVKLGMSLGIRVEATYSCSEGQPRPCGKCRQCRLRKCAIAAASKMSQ